MTRNLLTTILFVFLWTFSFAQNKDTSSNRFSFINFNNVTPRQFFDSLINADTTNYNTIIFIGPAPVEWLSDSDVTYLINYVYSTVKCPCLMAVHADYVPPRDYSTLGAQAQNLINAFRLKKQYFPELINCDKTDIIKAKELDDWWAANKNIK